MSEIKAINMIEAIAPVNHSVGPAENDAKRGNL